MKKILFLGINARYTHSNLAIRYLRNVIRDLHYKTEILEFSINRQGLELLPEIYKRKPAVLAISVYIWNSEFIRNLLPDIKAILPHCKLVLGGPEVSFNAQTWLEKFPEIDYIVCGHGEMGFRLLAETDFLYQQRIITKLNPKFEQIPFPYLKEDFGDLKHKYVYYESSRGCCFNCSYCLSSRSDQKLEFRKIEQVKSELKWLLERKPKIIKFIDRTFNIKADFSRAIWEFLIEQKTDTKFHFEIHPGILNTEDFKLLEKCPENRFQFEIGIQSTNRQTLQAIHREQNWIKVKSNVLKLKELANNHLHVDLIAGLPFENLQSLIKSFNDIISLQADHFQLGFLKILPGTEMQEKASEYEIIYQQQPPYQILKTKWLSTEDLFELVLIEKLVNSFYNSEHFKTTSSFLISKYQNPFILFKNLLSFFRKQNCDLQKRDWQSTAECLLNFVQENSPDSIELITDCLRWDWCQIATGHFYPSFINTSSSSDWKKEGQQLLKVYHQRNFSNAQSKRAIFFKATSPEFISKLKFDNAIYAFVPGGLKKEIIALRQE